MHNASEGGRNVALLMRPTSRFVFWVTTKVCYVTADGTEEPVLRFWSRWRRSNIFSTDLVLLAARDSGIFNVIVDFSGLRTINEWRLGHLFRLRQSVVAHGGKVALAGMGPRLALVFSSPRSEEVFLIRGTTAEAIAALAGVADR